MAAFSFTIPADAIASGDPASDVVVAVDRNLQRTVKQDVLVAKFGDGYEQRVGRGINTKIDNFSVNINNRSAATINEIAAFFDATPGENFEFTATDHDGDTVIKVVCDEYNITYVNDLYHSMSCKFRRVYEP
jgi:phage-related protein